MDPYKVLGIDRNASENDIKKAYHKLVMQYHPDKNPGNKQAEEKFKEVNNAYDILKDPVKKQNFDQFGSADGRGFGNKSFNEDDLFRAGFGGFGGSGFNFDDIFSQFGFKSDTRSHSNLDNRVVLNITVKDSYNGGQIPVSIPRNERCPHCHGNGTRDGRAPRQCSRCGGKGFIYQRRGMFANQVRCSSCAGTGYIITDPCPHCTEGVVPKTATIKVTIPEGVKNNQTIRIPGEGNYGGIRESRVGDLLVDFRVSNTQDFARVGDDLCAKLKVPFSTLIFGGEVDYANLDGKVYSIKVPVNSEIGSTLRMPGKGFRTVNSNIRGNIMLTISLDQSKFKNLTTEQKELIGKLKEKGL